MPTGRATISFSFCATPQKPFASGPAVPWRVAFGWFRQQQVDVLGHDYITDQPEGVLGALLIENLHKSVTRSPRTEKRPSAVTTKGDEVQVAPSVIAFKRIAHALRRSQNEEKPAP
jgi:hypothetical protein